MRHRFPSLRSGVQGQRTLSERPALPSSFIGSQQGILAAHLSSNVRWPSQALERRPASGARGWNSGLGFLNAATRCAFYKSTWSAQWGDEESDRINGFPSTPLAVKLEFMRAAPSICALWCHMPSPLPGGTLIFELGERVNTKDSVLPPRPQTWFGWQGE